MSLETQNTDNQEIDLSQISKKIQSYIDAMLMSIFKGILFIKKNVVVLIILFGFGAVLGYILDTKLKSYTSNVTVNPNFGSTDYLYQKINLLNSRIKERDFDFLKKTVGIAQPELINSIKIEPITDIFNFVGSKEANLELIKLMAEDGELSKIIEDPITSKNYPYHNISIATSQSISKEAVIDPVLKFIENSDYFKKIQAKSIQNLDKKITANDSIISQINLVINTFANKKGTSNDKMIYYNENTQLNEIINTKNALVLEQGNLAINKINIDKIVKESSVSVNLLEKKSINGKMKFIVPFLFLFLFISFKIVQKFYNSQLEKYNNQ
jgi:hypothetical protein